MYIEYGSEIGCRDESYFSDGESTSVSKSNSSSKLNEFNDFDKWYKKARSTSHLMYQKVEIDEYLDDHVLPRKENFNILQWWKANSPKYPIIIKMAHDILSIPITIFFPSESSFSVGGF